MAVETGNTAENQSRELLYKNLISYQKVEDYESMIRLVESETKTETKTETESETHLNLTEIQKTPVILYFYAFALSRRNLEGDRDKSLDIIKQALSLALNQEQEKENEHGETNENNRVLELFGLCGRIYKNKFIESNFVDLESLNLAIDWYRKAFDVRLNEFAGINLATLLVAKGLEFENSTELQNIGKVIHDLLEKKGRESLTYWDFATILEFNMISQNYEKAIEAAREIFSLRPQPPAWQVKSTMGNIQLVLQMRAKQKQKQMEQMENKQEKILNFWIEYFQAFSCTKSQIEMESGQKFEKIPVLIEHQNGDVNRKVAGFTQKYLSVETENDNDDDKKMGKRALRLFQIQFGAEENHQEDNSPSQDNSLLINSESISISKNEEDEETDSRHLLVKLEDSTKFKIHLPNSHYQQQLARIFNLK